MPPKKKQPETVTYPSTYIIIVSKDEREDLVDTIHSIHKTNASNKDYAIICLDDGDGGDAGLILETKFKRDNVIPMVPSPLDYGDIFARKMLNREEQKFGPNRARNHAAALAPRSATTFIFCDAHLTFNTNGWIKKITDVLSKQPQIGAVTCNMNGGKGMFWDPSTFEVKWNIYGDDKVLRVPASPAGFMAIRADLFRNLLGFNPLFNSYGVDEEISMRVWRAGFDIVSMTDILVDHKWKEKHGYKINYSTVLAHQYMGCTINLPTLSSRRNFMLYYRDKYGESLIEDVLSNIYTSDLILYKEFFGNIFTRSEEDFIQFNQKFIDSHGYIPTIPSDYPIRRTQTTPAPDQDVLSTKEIKIMETTLKVLTLNPEAVVPDVPLEGNSGVDLRACVPQTVTIPSMKRVIIPTGIGVEVPEGFEVQIRSRSGLAAKNGIFVLNSPATIDNNYQGELMVILFNTSEEPFTVHHGDRIAQMVVAPYAQVNQIEKVSSFERQSTRGSGGLGSTGVK